MSIHPTREMVCNARAANLIRLKARQLTRRGGFCLSDRDDLAQEMWLYLLSQADRFDPTRASLPTFTSRLINSAAAMLVRQRHRAKCIARCHTVSLEATMVEVDGIPTSARNAISEEHLHRRTGCATSNSALLSDECKMIHNAIRSLPSPFQQLSRRLMCDTPTTIAREQNISRRRIRNAVNTIRRQLERTEMRIFKKSGQPDKKRHM
jgi:RNA polymerase sigma factor (sigma-70 family)